MPRYVIIGTGAAGIAAAEAIRRQDLKANIVMVSEEPDAYYSRPGLAYFLTCEIPESQLYPFQERDYKNINIQPQLGRAVRIRLADHQVEMESGVYITYDRLLIATGATAVRGNVPGEDLQGVIKLDSLDDARLILKLSRKAHTAVVVGGGITALELVEGRARGVKTHYFLRGDRYWSNVLDETESRIIEHRLKEEGVEIHYFTELAEIHGKNGKVIGVSTKDGIQIRCNMVAIAVGVTPRKGIAVIAGLNCERGILVNEYMQSSDPAIFAAGDVAQVFDPYSGKSVVDSLWGPARQQGNTAGLNMTGQQIPYLKTVSFNVTRLAGLTTTIIGAVGKGRDDDLVGIARGDSETWRQLPDAIAAQDNFDVNHLRILVDKEHLIGAIVMGDQTLSLPIHHIVSKKVDITSIHDALLQPDACLGDLIADFWTHFSCN